MNTIQINQVIKRVVKNRYEIESHSSNTTNSYYVNIKNGDIRVQLRFSDHLNKQNKSKSSKGKTFLVGSSINEKLLEKYIQNRINTMTKVSLYSAFDKIEGKSSRRFA